MSPEPKIPDGIFFDWDGTLVDSLAFLTTAHNHVKSLYNLPLFEGREYLKYLGMQRDLIFQEIYGQHEDEAKKAFEEYYYAHHTSGLVVFDGVEKMLDTIKAQNIPMGLVSNKKNDFLKAEIRHLGWDRYFGNCIVGAGDTAKDKPDATPLRYALTLHDKNIDIQNIWYIGDTDIDEACAKNANCQAIILSHEDKSASLRQNIENMKKNTIYIKNYEELCGFLLQ